MRTIALSVGHSLYDIPQSGADSQDGEGDVEATGTKRSGHIDYRDQADAYEDHRRSEKQPMAGLHE